MATRPTNDVVFRSFLAANLAAPFSTKIGATLPEARAWGTTGFCEVLVIGGTPDTESESRHAVATLKFWANSGDSTKPPWAVANAFAEEVLAIAERHDRAVASFVHRPTMPTGYAPVVVSGFQVHGEPRRIPGDPSGYARFDFDVELWWAAISGGY